MHDLPLLTTLTLGLSVALVLGYASQRLGLSPILGYLLAGVLAGPFTPGPVADADAAAQLAELGVVLLMFGVGLHFHPKDLLAVKGIAVPGAVAQSAVATALGAGVAVLAGWDVGAGIIVGLAISVASTVVLVRALEDSNSLDSPVGHIAIGWLIVEDLFTVLVLVALPLFVTAGANGDVGTLVPALGMALFSRARYLTERAQLERIGVTEACYEEAEAAAGLAELLLRAEGAPEHRVRSEVIQIRAAISLGPHRPADEGPGRRG